MLASIIGLPGYRYICRILCQREGDSSGREPSIAQTSLTCGSDYHSQASRQTRAQPQAQSRLWRGPTGPAPNRDRNGTRQQIKRRPAALADGRRRVQLAMSLPLPHGGTVPVPTTSIGRLWHCFPRPAHNQLWRYPAGPAHNSNGNDTLQQIKRRPAALKAAANLKVDPANQTRNDKIRFIQGKN
jgi:hypothetical protein